MSADWFFIRKGFFSKKQVGPINEPTLLQRIDKGEIGPETLLCSNEKTHGHWVKMRTIRPAFKHWRKRHPDAA